MRKGGNSEWMVRKVLGAAENEGAQIELILLRDKRIEYCIGCDACQKDGKCVIKDDMQQIYVKLEEADVIIVGCPNYFKNVTALMKNFIDRTNAFVRIKPRKLKDKYAVGLCVGGEELEDTQHCENALVRFFKSHKMKIVTMVKAVADNPGSIETNSELENELINIGKKVSGNRIASMISYR